jgi:hypothetical protein
MPTIEEYLNLITSEHRQKAKFTGMVSTDVSAPVRVQDLMKSMIPIFDVDTAIGDQLDIIGQWAGISRNISIPIPGVYFSWDGTNPFVGWDYGVWQDESQPVDITVLPDDVYRTFVKAKIAANRWDGSLQNMYEVWDSVFTDITIFVQDNQDMSYNIGFVGRPVDALTLALIEQGYLPLKPEGVRVNVIYSPIDDNPFFGWDIESAVIAGWDDGSWARELA